MKQKIVKILNIVVTILIVLILFASAFMLVVSLTSKTENGGIPNVFGKAPIAVLTDSMKGDAPDDFSAGDLIICDVVDDPFDASYQVGDVVTFSYDINNDNYLEYVTHRIYKVNEDGTYLTKGDNNESYDQDPNNSVAFSNIIGSDILAVYTGTKIPGIGNFMAYLQTSMGFFLCILLPMIIFFLYEAVRVVINLIAYNKEKALAAAQEVINSSDLTEEQKQRAIAEYLAAQKGEQTGENNPEDLTPPENLSTPEEVPAQSENTDSE